MKRGRPLAQVGRRAQREMAEREEVRATVIAETGGKCVAVSILPGRCWGGIECHELIDRSVRPGVHLDPDYTVTICHAHHMAVSDDATLAREVGLSFYSYQADEARARAAELKAGVWRL